MAGITELTDANFDTEVLHSELPVLVDFWAPWCGPCRMVGPIVEELAGEWSGKIKVGKINVDESSATAAKFNIRSIPALLVFKNGEIAATMVGALPKAKISEQVLRVI